MNKEAIKAAERWVKLMAVQACDSCGGFLHRMVPFGMLAYRAGYQRALRDMKK